MKKLQLHKIAIIALYALCATSVYSMEIVKHLFEHEQQHNDHPTYVRHGNSISPGEHEFRKNRLPKVKAALERRLHRTLTNAQVPTIAIINSGGGYRAMLYSTGAECGLEKIGLANAITYTVGLSGSTWKIIPEIITQLPAQEFKNYIQKCAAIPFLDQTAEEQIFIANMIKIKETHKQPINIADFYGALLANRLLAQMEDKKQMCHLSDHAQRIESGNCSYPICSATDGGKSNLEDPAYYTITPHEVSNMREQTHIPTSAFGSTFEHGASTNNAPEQSAGYFMAMCGAAFGASFFNIEKAVTFTGPIGDWIKEIIKSIAGERILSCYGKVPNYMHTIDTIKDKKLPQKKHIRLVDAGLTANLPHIPVSGACPERFAHIQIFIDASAGEMGNEFKKTVAYAREHNLPFPDVNFEDIGKKTISIFKDDHNSAIPVVIYMPRISDKELWEAHKEKSPFNIYNLTGFDLDYETNHGHSATEHFHYIPEHSALVMAQAEFNMHVNKAAILHTINWWIDQHK